MPRATYQPRKSQILKKGSAQQIALPSSGSVNIQSRIINDSMSLSDLSHSDNEGEFGNEEIIPKNPATTVNNQFLKNPSLVGLEASAQNITSNSNRTKLNHHHHHHHHHRRSHSMKQSSSGVQNNNYSNKQFGQTMIMNPKKLQGSNPQYAHNSTAMLNNNNKTPESTGISHSFGANDDQYNLEVTSKLGFIKPDLLYGNNNYLVASASPTSSDVNNSSSGGLFSSDSQMKNLMKHINISRSAKKQPLHLIDPKAIDRMHSHIALTNSVQLNFINEAINTSESASQSRFRKYENNGQAILNKLNEHIIYKKEQESINQLTKAAFMQNNFIPFQKDEDIEENIGKEQNGKSPLAGKKKDIDNNHDAADGMNRMIAANFSGMRVTSVAKKQESKQINTEASKVTSTEEDAIVGSDKFAELFQKSLNEQAAAAREKEKEERIKEQAFVLKNRRTMKAKIDAIVATHERVVKDIEYAYSDITDDQQKKELIKRIRKLTEQQHSQPQQNQSSNSFNQRYDVSNDRLKSKSSTKIMSQNFNQSSNPQMISQGSSSSQFRNNQSQEKSSGGGGGNSSQTNPMKVAAQLDQSKQLLQLAIQKTENENKLYFEPGYKLREKSLNFELQNSVNKDQVLDRVLMNYFHQQDLLKEQTQLLRKAAQHKKGAASLTSRTKTAGSQLKELGSVLTKFQPPHIRLHLKDLQSSINERSTGASSARGSKTMRNLNDTSNQSNIDVNVFKSDYFWKKKQNQTINFSKVCSPAQMVLDFMKQDPNYKKQQSIEAIDFLVQFDPVKAKQEQATGGAIRDEESGEFLEKQQKRHDEGIMRRMFFHFSNKGEPNSSERFQSVNLESFVAMFSALASDSFNGIQIDELNEQSSESKDLLMKDLPSITQRMIFNKVVSKKENPVLNYYEFLESIRKASVQFYLQRIPEDNIPQPQELFQRFFTELIVPQHMRFRDSEEIEIIRMREMKQIDALVKLFETYLMDLFVFASAMRSSTAYDFNQIYLGFQEVFEIISKLDFFPNRISKNTIRYIYNYVLSFDQGLDFKDFCTCMHLVGLSIIRCPLKHTPFKITQQEIYGLQKKCRDIQYALFKLKADNLLNSKILKFIQDISVFYVHHDFLDILNLQQRIRIIKESNQKQLQII